MTRDHLIEDIRNVIEMGRNRSTPGDAARLQRAIAGLAHHLEAEHAPERVRGCLDESMRVLSRVHGDANEDTWSYALTCLEAALEFAQTAPAV